MTYFESDYSNCSSGCSIIKVAYEEHQLALGHEQRWQQGFPSFDWPSCLVWQGARVELAVLYETQTKKNLDFLLDFGCTESWKSQHFPAEQS